MTRRLCRLLQRQGSLPLAVAILRFRPLNLLTALLSIAFASAMILSQWGFREALFSSSVAIQKLFQADVVMISRGSVSTLTWMSTFPEAYLTALQGNPLVRATAEARIAYMRWSFNGDPSARLLTAVGINPQQADLYGPPLARHSSLLRTPGRILFDRKSRPEYGDVQAAIRRGTTPQANLERSRVNVAGLIHIGASFGADATAVMSRETLEMILPGMNSGEIEIGLIQLTDPTALISFLQDARRSIPNDVQLLTPAEFARMEQTFWDQSKPIGFIFLFGVGMSLFIGSAILFLVLNTIILLHNDDFATLMALGYTRSRLQRSIFHQSLLLSLMGYPIGYLIAEVVYAVTRMATNLPMAMDSQRIGIVFLFILSSSGASGLLTMRRLQETSPADAFH